MANAGPLDGKRVLIVIDDDYEDLEFWYPKLRMIEAGAEVTAVGPPGKFHFHGKHGYPARSDADFVGLEAEQFDALILPGGWAPDKLRREPHVLKLVQAFDQAEKLIAAICHGGWIAVSAGVYDGVRATGSPGIRDDLINAGAHWEDSPVVIDRHFISSRRPDDLPAFCAAIIAWFAAKTAP